MNIALLVIFLDMQNLNKYCIISQFFRYAKPK